jgi:hypothetical protein
LEVPKGFPLKYSPSFSALGMAVLLTDKDRGAFRVSNKITKKD